MTNKSGAYDPETGEQQDHPFVSRRGSFGPPIVHRRSKRKRSAYATSEPSCDAKRLAPFEHSIRHARRKTTRRRPPSHGASPLASAGSPMACCSTRLL